MGMSTARYPTQSWTACRRPCAPDRLLRPARHRGGENLVNQVSLPSANSLLDAITSFETALTWPEAQQQIQALLERGLQRNSDFEKRWPAVLGVLLLRLSHLGWSRFASATDCSVLFAGFIATMPGSDFSGPCIIGYGDGTVNAEEFRKPAGQALARLLHR